MNQNVDTPFNGEVLSFDLNTGVFTGKRVPGSNPNAPYAPRGMISGPNNVIYVADVGGFDGVHPGRIARYNSAGAFLGNVVTTGLSVPFYPMGVVIGPDGLLYVSNPSTLAYELPKPTAVANGDRFDVSWPAKYVGWQLQGQTNSLAIGLSSNWTNMAESTGTNFLSLLRNPSNDSGFYRLVAP